MALGRVKIDEVGGAGRFKWHMVNKIAEVNISPKINISSRTPKKGPAPDSSDTLSLVK